MIKNKFNNGINFENFDENAIVNYSDILRTYDNSQRSLAYKYLKARKLKSKGHKLVEIGNLLGIPKQTLYGWNISKRNPYSLNSVKKLMEWRLLPLVPETTNKFSLIVKLFAYILSDGSISNSLSNIVICGELEDMYNLRLELFRSYPGISCSIESKETKGIIEGREIHGKSHCLRVNSVALGRLLYILGAPVGDKVKQIINLQRWVFNLDPELKKIFLGVLWSAEGSKPIKTTRGYNLSFTMAKDSRLIKHHIIFMNQIRALFEDFGIKTTEAYLRNTKTKRKDGISSQNCYFYIKGDCENFIRFYERIPIFSNYKKQKLDEASYHYKDVLKRKEERQKLKQNVMNKANELFKLGYSVKSISEKLEVPRSTLRYRLGLL